MSKKLFVVSMLIMACLTGCSPAFNQQSKNGPDQVKTIPAENFITTDVEEGKNEDSYISIFYSVTGLTPEGGEEITAYITNVSGKVRIAKLTLVHRINTAIELIELNDSKKIGQILTSLQSLKVSDSRDKENINLIIGLLKELK